MLLAAYLEMFHGSIALEFVTRCLIGLHQKFATVYPAIYCCKLHVNTLHAFHWLTSEYMQLASGFMQLVAAGSWRNIVHFEEKKLIVH